MTEYRTSLCGAFGQQEISLSLKAKSGIDPSWLVAYFESEVRTGRRFQSGETVQIGWMIVMLRSSATGELEVWEPQFDSLPIKWTKGVNNTLRHLIIQKSVCEQFECEPDFPSLQQAGIVAPRFLESTDTFTMSRDQSVNNDSGWVFSVPNEPVRLGDGEFRSLFEISFYHTEAIAFLAMPAGASATKSNGVIEVTWNRRSLSSQNNELLKKLSESPSLV